MAPFVVLFCFLQILSPRHSTLNLNLLLSLFSLPYYVEAEVFGEIVTEVLRLLSATKSAPLKL